MQNKKTQNAGEPEIKTKRMKKKKKSIKQAYKSKQMRHGVSLLKLIKNRR